MPDTTPRIAELHDHVGQHRHDSRLGDARSIIGKGRVRCHSRRHRDHAGRLRQDAAAPGSVGTFQGADARDVGARHRRSARRAARAGRIRDGRDRAHSHRPEPDRLSDSAEGARDRFPARPPALLAAQQPRAARSSSIRNEIEQAIHDFFYERGFLRVDTPILTAAIGERSGLFATEYFDEGNAYLAQTGQLYGEAAAAAFGKIYTFGPTFRAEKSKTRRHLTEFWMIEPEVAWNDSADNMRLQEDFVSFIVQRCLERRAAELKELERDTAPLERVKAPFHRVDYTRRGRRSCRGREARSSGATTSAPRTRRCSSPTTTGRSS